MARTRWIVMTLAAAVLPAGCKARDRAASGELDRRMPTATLDLANQEQPAAPPASSGSGIAVGEGGAIADFKEKSEAAAFGGAAPSDAVPSSRRTAALHANKDGEQEAEASTPSRAWFPETFLFRPLVVTDAQGNATIPVRVPDRLTTWRVLALAHARNGAQAGAVTSFLGTLPVYVDPIVPSSLMIGDQIELPIQAVNTTDAPVTAQLSVQATHARLSGGAGTTTIPAHGTVVTHAQLAVTEPGHIELKAAIAGTDAVVRGIDVTPSGRPESVSRSGTLASARTLTIDGPVGSDPATDRVRLQVFPGALALLRSELGISLGRSGYAEDAYALLLAGRAPELLKSLGDTADPVALRDLTIIAGQRIVREARTLAVDSATLVAEAALSHPDSPVLADLGERAAAFLAAQQRPDGTFGGGQGWSLQRVLVATADATRAVGAAQGSLLAQQRALGVRMKAVGAFARNADDAQDGFTAAAMLASGAIEGPLAATLRERVTSALKDGPDGSKYLAVEPGIVRADGLTPSPAEATALAVLALQGDPKAPVADLGGTLLAGYDPFHGWGDGRANLACMLAVIQLFRDPLPPTVTITLTRDGTLVLTGTYASGKLKDVVALTAAAPGLAGTHEWKVQADPAVPGLGFALNLEGYVPWAKAKAEEGLELVLPASLRGRVGAPIDVAITAIAPGGLNMHITQGLPAGVQVDTPSLQKLVDAGTLLRFTTADGRVELFTPTLAPGAVFAATFRVVPTLAGTLHAPASKVEIPGHVHHVPPTLYTIK